MSFVGASAILEHGGRLTPALLEGISDEAEWRCRI
jgi:hypothetical protein